MTFAVWTILAVALYQQLQIRRLRQELFRLRERINPRGLSMYLWN